MDNATLAELHELRARAYGPAADITDDPAALERLEELERAAGATAPAAPAEPVAAATVEVLKAGVEASESSDRPEEQPASAAAGEPEPARARKRSKKPRSRRLKLWWALSLVAAAALAAGATYALTYVAPIATSNDAEQVATLEPGAPLDVPAGWFGIGPSSATYEFYGMTLFQTTYGPTGPGNNCFTVVPTASLPEPDADPDNWSYSGQMYSGCRVGDFPATIEMPIDSNAPRELTEVYPIGGAIQFVLDGDRVGVFVDRG